MNAEEVTPLKVKKHAYLGKISAEMLLEQQRWERSFGPPEYWQKSHDVTEDIPQAIRDAQREFLDHWQALCTEGFAKGWLLRSFDGGLFPNEEILEEITYTIYEETEEEWDARVAQLPPQPRTEETWWQR